MRDSEANEMGRAKDINTVPQFGNLTLKIWFQLKCLGVLPTNEADDWL